MLAVLISILSAAFLPAFYNSINCSQATSFIARSDGLNNSAYTTAICGLVASGTFQKLDALWIFGTNSQTNANLNLVSTSFPITVNGTMIFGPGVGYVGDGSSGYLSTGYTPSTNGVNFTQNSGSMGLLVQNPRRVYQYNGTPIFAGIGEANDLIYPLYTDGAAHVSLNSTNSALTSTNSLANGTNGLWIANRTSSTALTLYNNGTAIVSSSQTSTGLSSSPVLIGATTGPAHYSLDTFGAAFIGSGLTSGDITALQTYLAPFFSTNNAYAAYYGYVTQVLYDSTFNSIDLSNTRNPGYTWYISEFNGNTTPNAGDFVVNSGNVVVPTGNTLVYTVSSAATSPPYRGGLLTAGNTSAAFTATSSGTTLNVTALLNTAAGYPGPITPGQVLAGGSMTPGTGPTILAYGTNGTTGTGGIGTYALSSSYTDASSSFYVSQSYVGTAFTAGGYYEETVAIGSGGYQGGTWPIFWVIGFNGTISENVVGIYSVAAPYFDEIDFFEFLSATQETISEHIWTNTNGGGLGTNKYYSLGVASVNLGTPTYSNPHSYGVLWVPTTNTINPGTGLVYHFVDGVLTPVGNITAYTSTTSTPALSTGTGIGSTLGQGEAGVFPLQVGAGYDWPVTFYEVQVWH